MLPPFRDHRQFKAGHCTKPFGILRGDSLPTCSPDRQVTQFHRQNRRLQAIHATVDTLDLVIAFHQAAMTRKHRHAFGQRVVGRDDRTGITHRAEILARIEGKGTRYAERTHLRPLKVAKCACAQSSSTQSACFSAIAITVSMSAGWP